MTTSAKHALPVRNPRTGMVDFELTPATAAEVTALAGGLRRAQGTWAAAGVEHRAEVLGGRDALRRVATLVADGAAPGAVPCEYIVAPGLGARPSQERTA
jgi:acyl-CoA reductase-like NAD-dependent aldehyde dehydrogenase